MYADIRIYVIQTYILNIQVTGSSLFIFLVSLVAKHSTFNPDRSFTVAGHVCRQCWKLSRVQLCAMQASLRTPQSCVSTLSSPLLVCERNWLNTELLLLLPLFNHCPQGDPLLSMKSLHWEK